MDTELRRLLQVRRERLVQRAGEQRTQLALAVAPLAPAWRRVEYGLELWHGVRERPWLVAVPALLLVLWRPRAVLRVLAALPMLWRFGRAARWASQQPPH